MKRLSRCGWLYTSFDQSSVSPRRTMWPLTVIIITLFILINQISAYNILAIVSLPLKSHYMAFGTLFRELANRGHSVTVLNNFSEEKPVRNLTFISMSDAGSPAGKFTPLNEYENSDSKYWHLYNFYRHIELCPPIMRKDCTNFFVTENVKSHYAKETKYDVIFVEQFVGECGLAYAAAMYDAPIIGITSHTLIPWAYPRLGIPFSVITDSFYFSPAGSNPPLYFKIENFFLNLIWNTFGRWYHQRIIYEVFDKYLPGIALDVEKAARERIKMMFVYQHYSLTGSRLLSPQLLEIAGLHIKEPKPVPDAVESFLADAKNGVIYVSFGSNLKASTMSPSKRDEFLSAFRKIKQKVVWKYENSSFTQDGLFTNNWMPQMDILCHPKVKAFITHGGMLSISEAAFCGKPLIVVPFFGDQYSNAAAVRSAGLGVVLPFDTISAETLARAIGHVTTTEMQEKAKRISKLWRDRPQSVVDSAIYWTEYVARHGTGPPPLPSQTTDWFLYFLIDVAVLGTLLLLIVLGVIFVIYKFLRLLLGLVLNKKAKTE